LDGGVTTHVPSNPGWAPQGSSWFTGLSADWTQQWARIHRAQTLWAKQASPSSVLDAAEKFDLPYNLALHIFSLRDWLASDPAAANAGMAPPWHASPFATDPFLEPARWCADIANRAKHRVLTLKPWSHPVTPAEIVGGTMHTHNPDTPSFFTSLWVQCGSTAAPLQEVTDAAICGWACFLNKKGLAEPTTGWSTHLDFQKKWPAPSRLAI
jgi:hypothetical protein